MKLFLSLSVLFTAVLAQASPKCATEKIVNPNSDAALLFQLVQKNEVEPARSLLKQSAIAFDAVDGNCETPLQVAIRLQLDSMVDVVSQAYPDVSLNQYLPNGWTSYGYALKSGSVNVVQAFQARGAKAVQNGALGAGGNSPLEIAAYGNNILLMKKLIAEGAVVNPKPESRGYVFNAPISLAVAGHSVEAVQLLIASKAKLSGGILSNIVDGLGSISPLMIAASLGYTDLVDILLQAKADPRELVGANRSVLHVMKLNAPDSLRMLQLIIQANGATIAEDSNGVTPFSRFIQARWVEGAMALIQAKARPANALILATYHGLNSVVKALIEAKANVNFKGPSGNTALIYAVQQNNVDVIHQLIEAGADVNLANQSNEVPLMFVKSIDTANYLISQKADLSLRDRNGASLIMRLAALPEDLSNLISTLIRKGYDLNLSDSKKNTALHYAAKTGSFATLQTLIQAGIRSTVNQDGKSAYDLAYDAKRDSAILNLLSRNQPKALEYQSDCISASGVTQELIDLIKADQLDRIQALMEQTPVAVDAYGKECVSPWMIAMELRRESIMNYFAEVYTDVNVNKTLPNGESVYTYALMNGNLDLVKLLKSKGGALSDTHWGRPRNYPYKTSTELMLAAMNRKEVVEAKLNELTAYDLQNTINEVDGQDFTALDYTATYSARVPGIHEVVALLLSKGAYPRASSLKAFVKGALSTRKVYGSRIVTYPNLSEAKKELALVVDLFLQNSINAYSYDLFEDAAKQVNPALVRVLLKHKKEAVDQASDLRPVQYLTPCYTNNISPTSNECNEALELFANAGADVNRPYPTTYPAALPEVIKSYAGKTMLMVSASYLNLNFTSALIRSGAKVNTQAERAGRSTALMLAVPQDPSQEKRALPVIRLLLQAGADKSLTNASGRSAYSLAKERNLSAEVLNLLSY